MNDQIIENAMELIVSALKERGYDPYAQLYGYVSENDPAYITNHNGARSLIQSLDMELVKKHVLGMKAEMKIPSLTISP